MNKYEIRRQRLLYIRDRLCNGKAVEIARKIGREPSYVSRMLYPEGKKQKKRIADGMIELIESSFALPKGWMDGITGDIENDTIKQSYLIESINFDLCSYRSTEVNVTIESIRYASGGAQMLFGRRQAEHVKVMTYSGDAMAGTIDPGDIILIDIATNSFEGDGIYLFAYHDVVQVRRVQSMGETLRICADNGQYADWTTSSNAATPLNILGRVIYCYAVRRFV